MDAVVTRTSADDSTIPAGWLEVGFPADTPQAYALGVAEAGLHWPGARVSVMLDSSGRVLQVSAPVGEPEEGVEPQANGLAAQRLVQAFADARRALDSAEETKRSAQDAIARANSAASTAANAWQKAKEAAEKSGFVIDAASIKTLVSHEAFINEINAQKFLIAGPSGNVQIEDGAVTAGKIAVSEELWAKLAVFDTVSVVDRLVAENVTVPGEILGDTIVGKHISGSIFDLIGADHTKSPVYILPTGTYNGNTPIPQNAHFGVQSFTDGTKTKYVEGQKIWWEAAGEHRRVLLGDGYLGQSQPIISAISGPICPELPDSGVSTWTVRVNVSVDSSVVFDVANLQPGVSPARPEPGRATLASARAKAGEWVTLTCYTTNDLIDKKRKLLVRVSATPMFLDKSRKAISMTVSHVNVYQEQGSQLSISRYGGTPELRMSSADVNSAYNTVRFTPAKLISTGARQHSISWANLIDKPFAAMTQAEGLKSFTVKNNSWDRIVIPQASLQRTVQGGVTCGGEVKTGVLYFLVKEPGWYRVHAHCHFKKNGAVGRRGLYLLFNSEWGNGDMAWPHKDGWEPGCSVTEVRQLRAGDKVYFSAFQDSGSSLNLHTFNADIEWVREPS